MTKKLFTPKTLAEFWASAPSEDTYPQIFHDGNWKTSSDGPNLNSHIKEWRWPSQEKAIDFSRLAGSRVLCQFNKTLPVTKVFDFLSDMTCGGYYAESGVPYDHCIPAIGIWQACNGNLPELPEGLDVTVRAIPLPELSVVQEQLPLSSTGNNPKLWHYTAFRVNGKLDGYKWHWE